MFTKGALLLLLPVDAVLGVRIFLNPPAPSAGRQSSLTPAQARAVVSHHLGLEAFDPVQDLQGAEQLLSGDFVGKDSDNGLLLTLSEDVAPDVIPSSLRQSFSLSSPSSVSAEMSLTVSSYLQRAEHVYDEVYSMSSGATTPSHRITGILDVFSVHPSYATELFFSEASQLVEFIEESLERNEKGGVFGGFELKSLSEIRDTYGRDSELYKLASETMRAILDSALSKPHLSLAVLTYPREATHTLGARQQPPQSPLPPPATPSPQLPIGGVSTCYTTADACSNATSSCSGHGACAEAQKAGRTCFVCACTQTVDDESGQRQDWAGDACERKDVSAPFVLITGTVIGIIVIIFGSVSLLYAVGSESLPSTLVASAGHTKHD